MAAIARELDLGGKVAVIVPSRELQRQWEREMYIYFESADIGLMGNGHSDSLVENDILIAVVNSASEKELGLEDGESGLMVVDECHRLGAEKFQVALDKGFPSRLGLSATRERTDGAHDTILARYFGKVVYSLGYEAAMAGGYISQVKVAQIEVQLSDDEQFEFDELSEAISASQFELSKRFGIPLEPYSRFMEEVHNMATNGDMKQGMAAKRYISSITKRRKLLANTPKKSEVLATLVSAISNSNRAIVFTETISGVTDIYNLLKASGIATEQLHSQLLARERVAALHMFETGQCKALVAAKVLDEGIDVPEADLAIIVSATKTRRQMIQRMGRVLRPKKDGRPARFVLIYVAGTSEDPANGAHDAFFNEVIDISKESKIFKQPLDKNELTEFLNP
jgi:superfamily II DNA or RNA helicase